MATINLGNLTFTHKGDYDNSTAYSKNDVVYYSTNGNAYIAKQSTTGNAPTNATYWNQFAQGSGGIWSSGLSLGSAGQVVKVNSGGSALEFGTVSSDFVRLLTSDYSTAVNSVNLDNIFSSTYRGYKIILEDIRASSGNHGELQIRFLDTSGSEISGSHYQMGAGGQYVSGTSGNAAVLGFDNNRSSARLGNWNTANATEPRPNYIELSLGQMHLNKEHALSYQAKLFDPNGNYDAVVIGGIRYTQSVATRGINVQINGGGNFSAYRMTVWGMK